jgi:replication factor A1
VSGIKIIIILGVTVVSGPVDPIGTPTALSKDEQAAAPVAAAAPAPVAAAPVVKAVSANPYQSKSTSNAAPRGGRDSMGGTTPISELNPYLNRWCIQVRITNKTEKSYTNAKGDGKLFSVDMQDDSGELRGTGFNEECDRIGGNMEIGKCYKIRGGRLKQANKKFSHIQNDYELTFGRETQLEEVADDSSIAKVRYDFVDFANLEAMPKENAYVDVCAVVVAVNEVTTIMTKKGKNLDKKEIEIMDKSKIAVRCTLWGKQANDWDKPVGATIAIKGAQLSDFNGCSMSIGMSSTFTVDPDIDEAHDLRAWYESEGKDADRIKIQGGGGGSGRVDRRIMMHQLKDENIGMSSDPGKQDWFVVRGTVTFCPNQDGNFIYNACPSDNCQKKVIEEGDRQWHCAKCNQTFGNFEHRMIPRFSVQDATGQAWISVFNDVAQQIFGATSAEMGELKDSHQEDAFNAKVAGALWKQYIFKCRAKNEVYNDEARVRVTGVSVTAVDPVQESKYLIEQIKLYA